MLFFKSKAAPEEILPPPPPFPAMGLEDEKEKYKEHGVAQDTHKEDSNEKELEFEELAREVKSLSSKKGAGKKERLAVKAKKPAKSTKRLQKQLKKIPAKQIKGKKLAKIKAKIKEGIKRATPIAKKEKLSDIDFILPQETVELGTLKEDFELPKGVAGEEAELPEKLEDFDIESFGEELEKFPQHQIKLKPDDVLEAEDEIKSAIEKIKKQEQKKPFFKRLFAKKEGVEEIPDALSHEISGGNEISAIQDSISKARQALMRLDLEAARKNYVEAMRIYNKIKPEEQAKFYHDIKEIYIERKSAEELKA